MTDADLVRKANQIATFFAAYPDDEAIDGVVGHMRTFWEPRMRRQLVAYLGATGGGDLSALAIKAGEQLGADQAPGAAE